MPNYAITVTKRKSRKAVIRDLDRFTRYEITAGTAGFKGEVLILKTATALANADTLTVTVA